VIIFWNGPDGFKPDRRAELPGQFSTNLEVADLNGDGYLDLIEPNYAIQQPISMTALPVLYLRQPFNSLGLRFGLQCQPTNGPARSRL